MPDHLFGSHAAEVQEGMIGDHIAVVAVHHQDHLLQSYYHPRVLPQLCLGLLAFGHVLHRSDDLDQAPLVVPVNLAQRKQMPDLTIGPYNAVFISEIEGGGFELLEERVAAALSVLGMHHRYYRFISHGHTARQLVQLIPLVGPRDRAIWAETPASDMSGVLRVVQPRLALAQSRLRPLAFLHVRIRSEPAKHLAGCVLNRRDASQKGAKLPLSA